MSDIKPADPVLDNNDLQSIAWIKLQKYFEARLQELRARNDGNLDAIQTASLRGEIRNLKSSLALATRDPAMQEADEG